MQSKIDRYFQQFLSGWVLDGSFYSLSSSPERLFERIIYFTGYCSEWRFSGVVGSYCKFSTESVGEKNENRSTFGKVMGTSMVAAFWLTVYTYRCCLLVTSHTDDFYIVRYTNDLFITIIVFVFECEHSHSRIFANRMSVLYDVNSSSFHTYSIHVLA